MSFALAELIPEVGCYRVFCVACLETFGTMTGDSIARAVHARGPMICPRCRRRHCDFCGRVTTFRLSFVQGHRWRTCPVCVQERVTKSVPAFTEIVRVSSLGNIDTSQNKSYLNDVKHPAKCTKNPERKEGRIIRVE